MTWLIYSWVLYSDTIIGLLAYIFGSIISDVFLRSSLFAFTKGQQLGYVHDYWAVILSAQTVNLLFLSLSLYFEEVIGQSYLWSFSSNFTPIYVWVFSLT